MLSCIRASNRGEHITLPSAPLPPPFFAGAGSGLHSSATPLRWSAGLSEFGACNVGMCNAGSEHHRGAGGDASLLRMLCRLCFEPFPGICVLQLVDSTTSPTAHSPSQFANDLWPSCRMPCNMPAGVWLRWFTFAHMPCRPWRERTWYLAAVSPILQ